jgi:hypothetical protein
LGNGCAQIWSFRRVDSLDTAMSDGIAVVLDPISGSSDLTSAQKVSHSGGLAIRREITTEGA